MSFPDKTMGGYLHMLAFLMACLLSSLAANQNQPACSADVSFQKLASLLTEMKGVTNVIERAAQEDMQKKLTDMKQAQEELRQEQLYLKTHTLKRLDAIDEKTEWFLSKGQQGAHPLSDRMSQMEEQLNRIEQLVSVPKDCQEVYNMGSMKSGIYTISPEGVTKINVYCEQELDGGGWTVFQCRHDGSVNFYRDWAEYKTGFGELMGEFWLGNDNLHLLSKGHDQKLKIELTYNEETKYADYSTFWIGNESLKYRLTVSGFSGSSPPGDSMTYHNQSNFSTKDHNNDAWIFQHSAQLNSGAWWYLTGHWSNLNGVYGSNEWAKGVNWRTWKGYVVSLTGTRMMIKKRP